MSKIYLAGPMQGIENFNFPAFDRVASILRNNRHEVFNPADKDREKHGDDFAERNKTGNIQVAELDGFSLRDALALDTQWICKEADVVFMLKGWERSFGARAEHALATALKLEIWYE